MTNFRFDNVVEQLTSEQIDSFCPASDSSRGAKRINLKKGLVIIPFLVMPSVPDYACNAGFYYEADCEAIECSFSVDKAEKDYFEKAKKKLHGLLALKAGWDGYDALPLEKASYDNTKTALGILLDHNLISRFSLFPNTNGTLILTARGEDMSSISIGNESFSYFTKGKDGETVKGEVPFTKGSFVKAVNEVAHVLGWRD